MKLSIIIVSFNTAQLTKKCIDSIVVAVQQSTFLRQKTEILVVDNNSTDDSIATLKQVQKTIPIPLSIFANKTNVGFAAANNQALLQAKGTYLLLLNSDTRVQTDTLDALVNAAQAKENDGIAIFAASLVNPDGTPQPQGGDLPSLSALSVFAFMLDDVPLIGTVLPSHQHTGKRFQKLPNVPIQSMGWVGGTAMMIRSSVIPQIGLLDDHIFMYAEDIEYCWRAHQADWRVATVSSATVVHLGSQSSSSERALEGECISLHYVLAKHLPMWQIPLAQLLLKIAVLNRLLVFSMLKQPQRAAIYRKILGKL